MTPTNEQIERFVKEVRALTLEQQALCMRYAVQCQPILVRSLEVQAWAKENMDYMKTIRANQIQLDQFKAFTPFIGEFMELLRAQDPEESNPAGN